ncbi:rCG56744 [Rattus norvegicus]|uniref:RCG56744 n=1 Tax=Rattus norvegicus TaxID=10116 RepID=A6KJN2_RAT|nr:rCG56744 [Rattus norvegicus]
MIQPLRGLAAFPEDLNSVPSTLIRLLTTTCNYSFRGSDTLFWPLCTPAFPCMCTHTHTHIYI